MAKMRIGIIDTGLALEKLHSPAYQIVPIALNFEVAEAAAKAFSGTSKAILAEKPLAPTLEQAKAFVDLPRKYRVSISIAEKYR